MQTSPQVHTDGHYYCSSQGIFFENLPPKMQSILPYIAYQGSTFICLCCPLDSQNFHTSKHSTCSASCVWVFFLFLSNVIFVCPDDPSLIFWNSPTLESLLLSGVFGPSFRFWRMIVSHSYLWLWAYARLCFLFSASSLHITQSVWFFVRGNYWLRSQPSARCFSLSLFSLSSYLSDFHSVPLSFSFLQSPFGLPIVLAFFSGPCVPLTLSLTHFAHSHRWVNHTAGLSLNLSFLPTPMHVHKDHQRAGKLI